MNVDFRTNDLPTGYEDISAGSRTWPNVAIPPGESLVEELNAREIDRSSIASSANLSTRQFADIISGRKPITADLALTLESTLDIDASFWMNLQSDHDLTIARVKRARS